MKIAVVKSRLLLYASFKLRTDAFDGSREGDTPFCSSVLRFLLKFWTARRNSRFISGEYFIPALLT